MRTRGGSVSTCASDASDASKADKQHGDGNGECGFQCLAQVGGLEGERERPRRLQSAMKEQLGRGGLCRL